MRLSFRYDSTACTDRKVDAATYNHLAIHVCSVTGWKGVQAQHCS
jgi:hypothetical protein